MYMYFACIQDVTKIGGETTWGKRLGGNVLGAKRQGYGGGTTIGKNRGETTWGKNGGGGGAGCGRNVLGTKRFISTQQVQRNTDA